MNRSFRSGFLSFVLGVVLGSILLAAVHGAENSTGPQLPTPGLDLDSGLIFNRGAQPSPVPPSDDCPDGLCPVPRTAPVFEAPPVDPLPPVNATPAPAVAAEAKPSGMGLTPEQKAQLKGLVIQLATLMLGAFMGSGSASPFIRLILEKLLGAVGGATVPPGATPAKARTRRRVVKRKAKAKA